MEVNSNRLGKLESKLKKLLFRSLWLASIWWEAGYQQGKSDSKSPTCNEIRVNMEQKEIFKEHHLPNCKVNGQWTVSCNYFQIHSKRPK